MPDEQTYDQFKKQWGIGGDEAVPASPQPAPAPVAEAKPESSSYDDFKKQWGIGAAPPQSTPPQTAPAQPEAPAPEVTAPPAQPRRDLPLAVARHRLLHQHLLRLRRFPPPPHPSRKRKVSRRCRVDSRER